MNHDDSERSRAWTWVMYVLALPVLYLLSVPPVVCSADRLRSENDLLQWALAYSWPYDWLMEETPLRVPLLRYAELWMEVMY